MARWKITLRNDDVKKDIVYRTRRGYVEQRYTDEYVVFVYSVMDLDGIKDYDIREVATYTPNYIRDNFGRTTSVYWDYDPMKSAIDKLNWYTKQWGI